MKATRKGEVTGANIVAPTAHNFLGLEEDMKALVGQVAHRPTEEIRRRCEMLVRAYDPCYSCSGRWRDTCVYAILQRKWKAVAR